MHTHAQSSNSHYTAPYSIFIDSLESFVINQDAWLAQLVERRTALQEVEGSSLRPDQHSGS